MLKKIIIFLLILCGFTLFGIGCPVNLLFGLYCPGCGITRMIISIINLDFYQAFRYNSLAFIYLCGYLLYMFVYWIVKHKYDKKIKCPNWVLYILIIFAIIYGILRNTSMFDWLAPVTIK